MQENYSSVMEVLAILIYRMMNNLWFVVSKEEMSPFLK